MKKTLRTLLLEENGSIQYKTLNDAASAQKLPGLSQGETKIWYVSPEFGRDFRFGLDFVVDKMGMEPPSSKNIDKTHTLVGSIRERDLNSTYSMMQGEAWSPNGEARNLIGNLGLEHTSMSVGDVLEIDGDLFFVDRHGFKKLVNGNVVESIKRTL